MYIYINDKEVAARNSETILTVAKREGFDIPSLCHHDALEDIGACRLCMVEVLKPGSSQKELVASCLYQVEEGLKVYTDTNRVKSSRQTVLNLLMARSPNVKILKELSELNNIKSDKYQVTEPITDCIMCQRCVRACEKMGFNAISAVGKGVDKQIATPFLDASDLCTGCGSCFSVCPTGHIQMVDTETTRTIWNKTFELVLCDRCNKPFMTKALRDYAIKKYSLPADYYVTCPACRREKLSFKFAETGR
jgi:NADH dehydrogenase/NADH:ubiquinone oxidoreductase subunit G